MNPIYEPSLLKSDAWIRNYARRQELKSKTMSIIRIFINQPFSPLAIMRVVVFYILICLLLVTAILTANESFESHTKLVAVMDIDANTTMGSIADLYLEVKPGDGKVFIDTFPASKLDTQMSTRLAKNMACKFIDEDCTQYDFFYTIRASSPIVGGPSASASATIATIAAIMNLEIKEDVVMTGTINSGYIIGPVGGVKEKVEAAASMNMSKILIPAGKAITVEEDNSTFNLTAYGKNLSIEVIEVDNVQQALYHMTGINIEQKENIIISGDYADTLGFLSDKLCNRMEELKTDIENRSMPEELNATIIFERAKNTTIKAENALELNHTYARASYCFSANVDYLKVLYILQEPTEKQIFDKTAGLKSKIGKLNKLVNEHKIQTITDLQAFMIIKQRIIETQDTIEDIEDNHAEWGKAKTLNQLAYANERFHSAIAWSEFFKNKGKKFKLDNEDLKESCISKLSETTEFFQYMNLVLPGILIDTKEIIERAETDANRGNYELCLFKSSLARAQINLLASSIGVPEDKHDELIDRKLIAAHDAIVEQQQNNIFPILGYSYYEYATSLKNDSKIPALLYSEYSLELSNLDAYLQSRQLFEGYNKLMGRWMVILIVGMLMGVLLVEIADEWNKRKK